MTSGYAVRYNIAPTPRSASMGLGAVWAKDLKIGSRMINARSEEAATKPAFRSALRKQRCLVPCTGFFEWKVVGDPTARKPAKQPYYIRRRDNRVFGLAGIWDRWNAPEGALVESYSILTTTPNELVSTLHDRMPVIVRHDDYGLWLDPNVQEAKRLQSNFAPFPAADLVANPVSTKVNSPANDTPECTQVNQ